MSCGSGTIFLAGTVLTNPGLHHVSLPVELKEGRVLIKLCLPLCCSFLQVSYFPVQGLHLCRDVLLVVIVLGHEEKARSGRPHRLLRSPGRPPSLPGEVLNLPKLRYVPAHHQREERWVRLFFEQHRAKALKDEC